ncbi:ATP-binding protein [Enterovibrio baiacu]|uniref:ATP-binding protein n=1 Tax=Enterovibrio baiacu TaxID=2491023 RepID=UPI001010FE3E|nr:ATP-binding protein [Enterovibrio baiacu]MBE1273879.1 ATP-binding protein [Enterovibrio baiacu]
MKNISAFPVWDINNNKIIDGTFLNVSTQCLKAKTRTCVKHYEKIRNVKGFHICPFGLTSYSTGDAEPSLYSSIKVQGYYDVTKTKKLPDYLPTMPPQVFLASINKSRALLNNPVRGSKIDSDMVDFSIHEVRRFNGEIKRVSEELLLIKENDLAHVQKKVKNIFASSSLISVRLNAFDLEENPEVITSQSKFNTGIFKKFQKASHCLDTYARDRGVRIMPFRGTSHMTIDMYQIFDLIPFVILENAIKYSPEDQSVSVHFEEVNQSSLSVSVSSIGPCNTESEIEKIFCKKYRGNQAELFDGTGGGYGLYFAKMICDMHNIKISVKSGAPMFELNGIQFGDFTLTLEVER